jgi:conjugative relaxase-like TrwC/TraI family protein
MTGHDPASRNCSTAPLTGATTGPDGEHDCNRWLHDPGHERLMAWFRPMGADEVAYHKATVVGRADDHPGAALDYYGSRGETPLRWGGAGAARLGLYGEVTPEAYEAAFGTGGFRDPGTGARLVSTKRPGFELVVSAHKSVAVLGVIDRADAMHRLLDVETDATMDWLDSWFQQRGGRRGRAQVRTETGGLVYARTRHGTSRAGDPSPHDHVLVANVVEMLDDVGGFKGLDSASLRDTVEAATMVGRLHSAARAVSLGYRIEADNGPSGNLRHWRIAGIPVEVDPAPDGPGGGRGAGGARARDVRPAGPPARPGPRGALTACRSRSPLASSDGDRDGPVARTRQRMDPSPRYERLRRSSAGSRGDGVHRR